MDEMTESEEGRRANGDPRVYLKRQRARTRDEDDGMGEAPLCSACTSLKTGGGEGRRAAVQDSSVARD